MPNRHLHWRAARPSASAATFELDELEAQAPTPGLHDPPPAWSDGETLYQGRRAPLDIAGWEMLGWTAEKAREQAAQLPHATRTEVLVISPNGAGPLEHYPYHSPGGFNWGHGGPGCAELARCILLHHHGVTPRERGAIYPPSEDELPVSYLRFKADKIAPLASEQPWTITAAEIRAWEQRTR